MMLSLNHSRKIKYNVTLNLQYQSIRGPSKLLCPVLVTALSGLVDKIWTFCKKLKQILV